MTATPKPPPSMWDWQAFEDFCIRGSVRYHLTAPTVSDYLDGLYVRVKDRPDQVPVREVIRANQLASGGEWMQPNLAANHVFKLMAAAGLDTTGHAGF